MTSLSARTVPVALALALLAAASMAEDRPNTTLVQKSKSSAVTSSTAQKSRTPAATPVNGDATVKAGSKQRAPATGTSTPTAEQSYEGCPHGKGAEA
jgi:hypothetical protein